MSNVIEFYGERHPKDAKSSQEASKAVEEYTRVNPVVALVVDDGEPIAMTVEQEDEMIVLKRKQVERLMMLLTKALQEWDNLAIKDE